MSIFPINTILCRLHKLIGGKKKSGLVRQEFYNVKCLKLHFIPKLWFSLVVTLK